MDEMAMAIRARAFEEAAAYLQREADRHDSLLQILKASAPDGLEFDAKLHGWHAGSGASCRASANAMHEMASKRIIDDMTDHF